VKRLKPEIKIIGVEPVDADAMYRSLKKKERVTLAQVGIFADGVAVKQVGEETFRLCRELVDEVILVDTDAICAAIKDVFEDTRSILEPAGALSIAGAKLYVAREKLKNKTLVAIASGANMNFDRLRHVAERAELGEQREAVLSVTIRKKPAASRRSALCWGRAISPNSIIVTPIPAQPTCSSGCRRKIAAKPKSCWRCWNARGYSRWT